MARKPPSSDIQTMMNQLLRTGITGGGRGRRSPLFRWMYARADDLKKMLDDVQPSWDAVAAVLPTTDDVKDGSGKRPNGERVRKTWYEVRQAKRWDEPRHASTAGKATPAPVESKPLPTRERQPSPLLPPSATASVGRPADHNTHPRERKRLVLHSPIPLAEGEPAPNDGSRLPAPLRPDNK